MNEGPSEPTEPPASGRASRPSGSRFEDLTNFEVPVDAVAAFPEVTKPAEKK